MRAYHGLAIIPMCIWIAAAALFTQHVRAHETDQYSVPVGREYADLSGYFSDAVRDVLVQTIAKLNSRIESTLQDGEPTAATARFHAQETVARTLYHGLPLWVTWVEPLENRLLTPAQRGRYPGLVTVYHPPAWIYQHPALLLDPTKLPRLWHCGTIVINGVEFGTDKMMHFTHMGWHYVYAYFRAREAGKGVEEATQVAVALGTGSNPFLSEATWLGLVTTGVWSNSDLLVNCAGMKFFRNLTETVRVGGRDLPPLLRRDGHFWRLSARAQVGNDFFGDYVTDHWNEVFNPNVYMPAMSPFVRVEIRNRCDDTRQWYRNRHLQPLGELDYLDRMVELSTDFGEDYGYRGHPADMINLVTVCDWPEGVAERAAGGPERGTRDALGRTRLWWAAADGDAALVAALLDDGADPNQGDIDGEAALHAAARGGHPDVIALLAEGGAELNARALYGSTPLHVAARAGHAAACEALLSAGAALDATDDFGCTALDDAALHRRVHIVALLETSGARFAIGAAPAGNHSTTGASPVVAKCAG
jgi:hypothetical protein